MASLALGGYTGQTSALSPSGKYEVTFDPAPPPNTVHITIREIEKNAIIYSMTLRATSWGFDPNEKYFAIEGTSDATENWGTAHWFTLLDLNPDKATEGEPAEIIKTSVSGTAANNPVLKFSPHGKYLFHAFMTNQDALYIKVYSTKDGSEVFTFSGPVIEAYGAGGNAGWGFSPDINDGTFLLAYLSGPDRYSLFIKKLGSPELQYILQETDISGGAYWRFSPCGDYFAWIHDNTGSYRHYVRFYSTLDGSEITQVDAEWFKHLKYTAEGHFLVLDNQGTQVGIDLEMANEECPDETAPGWPIDAELECTVLDGSRILLRWPPATDSMGVTAHNIYEGSKKLEETGTDTVYLITGLKPDSSYNLGVKAGDANGNWSSKLPSSMDTPPDNAPYWYEYKFLGVGSTEDIKSTSIKLSWFGATDDFSVEGYILYMDNNLLDSIFRDTSYTVKELIPYTEYDFLVQAYDASGNISSDGPVYAGKTKMDYPPEWPVDSVLRPGEVTETSIAISWPVADDDFGLKTYLIFIDGQTVDSTNSWNTSYNATGLEEGTIYSFAIRARDNWGNLSEALEAGFSTLSPYIEKALVTGYGAQMSPDIDGDFIVWEDNRNENYDIYMIDLGKGDTLQITDDPADQKNPRVWQGRVVWEDNRNGNLDIYLYDPILGEMAICTDPAEQNSPDISGTKIVWSDKRNSDADIYLYDMDKQEEELICGENGDQLTPSVSSRLYSFVAWLDYRDSQADIYMNSILSKKEIVVSNNGREHANPVVWAEGKLNEIRVYYSEFRSTSWDIYMYYPYFLPTGYNDYIDYTERLYVDDIGSNQELPHGDDAAIVYLDDTEEINVRECLMHGNFWDGETKIVTKNESDKFGPRTSGGRIVWTDWRNGSADIYLWDRPPGADIQLSIEENEDPIELDKQIIYKLFVYNDGPDRADSVKIIASIPEGFIYRGTTAPGTAVSKLGNTLLCTIPHIQSGDSTTMVIRFDSNETGSYTFIVETEGDYFDPFPSNNSITETTDVSFMIHDKMPSDAFFGADLTPDGICHMSYIRNDTLFHAVRNKYTGWSEEFVDILPSDSTLNPDLINAPYYNAGYQRSKILKDLSGRVHITQSYYVWNHDEPDSTIQYLFYYVRNNNGWRKDILQQNYYNRHERCGIQLLDDAPEGEVQLAYSYLDKSNDDYSLFYKETKDQLWQEPEEISYGLSIASSAIDSEKRPHFLAIAHPEEDEDQIMQLYRNVSGEWQEEEFIFPDWKDSESISHAAHSIDFDSEGNPRISYNADRKLKIASLEAENWDFITIDSVYWGYTLDGSVQAGEGARNYIMYDVHTPERFKELIFAFNHSNCLVKQVIAESNEFDGRFYYYFEEDNEGNFHICYRPVTEALTGDVNYLLRPPLPYLISDRSKLNFGILEPGQQVEKYFLISNPTDQRVNINRLSIEGSTQYELSSQHSFLEPGQSDTVKVVYSPEVNEQSNAKLVIWFNEPEKMFIDLALLGRTSMPIISIKYDRTRFEANKGESDTCRFYATNEGDLPLEIYNVFEEYRLGGGSVIIATDFELISHDCSTIQPGDSCEVVIAYSPSGSTSQHTGLYIQSNDPEWPEKSLSLSGYPASPKISLSVSHLDFAYVETGQPKQKEIHMTNTGIVDIEIASIELGGDDADAFSINNSCTILESGETCIFSVGFNPISKADYNAELMLKSNASDKTVSLTGTSFSYELTPDPRILDFGVMGEDDGLVQIPLVIENTGEVNLENINTIISGRNAFEFGYNDFPSSLNIGEQKQENVWFDADYPGFKEAYLIFEFQQGGGTNTDTVFLKALVSGSPIPLSVSAGANPLMGLIPLEISFQATAEGGTPPYSYHWDFGNGESSVEEDPVYTYQQAGKYTVELSLSDQEGSLSAATIDLLVGADIVPVVQIYAFPELMDSLLRVQFAAEIMGGRSPYIFAWNFGDGTTSDELNPLHNFTEQGEYEVEFSLTDGLGNNVLETVLIPFSLKTYSLSGIVFSEDSLIRITGGKVHLFSHDNPEPEESYFLSAEGTFEIEGLLKGGRILEAVPDTLSFPNYLPTYNGGKLSYFEAQSFMLDRDLSDQNIYCRKAPEEGDGQGNIQGSLTQSDGSFGFKMAFDSNASGIPVMDAMVYLLDKGNDELKAADRTDLNGEFSFRGLENGVYSLLVDYHGIPMSDSNSPIEIGNPNWDISLNAIISTSGISVDIVSHVEISKGIESMIKLYPNPARDYLVIKAEDAMDDAEIRIEVYSLTGQKLKDTGNRNMADAAYMLDVQFLSPGSYQLRIYMGESVGYYMLLKI